MIRVVRNECLDEKGENLTALAARLHELAESGPHDLTIEAVTRERQDVTRTRLDAPRCEPLCPPVRTYPDW